MRGLAQTICAISAGGGAILSGRKVTQAMVAFVAGAEDERRYQLDHKKRVSHAIALVARQDVGLIWAEYGLLGCGVDAVVYEDPAIVHADRVSQVLQRLNNIGWQEDEAGFYVSHYGKQIATVWEDEVEGWSYDINHEPASHAGSKAQAMRGCAALISGS